MTFPPPALKSRVEQVAQALIARNATLAVVETACGGLISAALLNYPGASKFYRGGVTVYSLDARVALAGWTEADVAGYRGPTQGIVAGLAAHVRDTMKASFALAESGTAGPTGGKTPNRTP